MKYRATFILWSFWYASEQFDDHSVNASTTGINFKVDKRDVKGTTWTVREYIQRCLESVIKICTPP